MGDKTASSYEPITETVRQQITEIIKRQTDYDDETIKSKLVEHNNNVIDIIREYMNPTNKSLLKNTITPKTTNQKVYYEIRKLMDDASADYRKKKELESKQ
jgi:hypothetical protein